MEIERDKGEVFLAVDQLIISYPLKTTTKNKGNTKQPTSRKRRSLKTFWKVDRRPKPEKGEDRRSSGTRQNNKRADRKMEFI